MKLRKNKVKKFKRTRPHNDDKELILLKEMRHDIKKLREEFSDNAVDLYALHISHSHELKTFPQNVEFMVRHDIGEVIFKYQMKYLCQNSSNQYLNQNSNMNICHRNLNHLPTSVPF